MSKLKYVGLFLVILIFGILFIPKIIDRVKNDTIVQDGRSKSGEPLQYITLNGEAKSVPEFTFLNQDSLFISNEDFKGKVYVAEFFFTSCPSICPIMNKNMKKIETQFGSRTDFGDGLNPKLDENGRPMFFFWQNDAKACFVSDGGLGMSVYEWRPKFANGNAVGIELERGSTLERR